MSTHDFNPAIDHFHSVATISRKASLKDLSLIDNQVECIVP